MISNKNLEDHYCHVQANGYGETCCKIKQDVIVGPHRYQSPHTTTVAFNFISNRTITTTHAIGCDHHYYNGKIIAR